MGWIDIAQRMSARNRVDETRIAVQADEIVLRIATSTAKGLGWTRGDHVTLEVGDGDHAGLVRAVKRRPGWKLQRSRAAASDHLIKVSRRTGGQNWLPAMPDRLPATAVETRIARDAGGSRSPSWASVDGCSRSSSAVGARSYGSTPTFTRTGRNARPR